MDRIHHIASSTFQGSSNSSLVAMPREEMMAGQPPLSLTSVRCKRIVLGLLFSQVLVIGLLYCGGTSLWNMLPRTVLADGSLNSPYGDHRHYVILEPPAANVSNSTAVDVHYEGPDGDLTFRSDVVLGRELDEPGTRRVQIAIGLGMTTRKVHDLSGDTMESRLPFFRSLLTSFCKTCSLGYDYHFFLAYDYNDEFMSKRDFVIEFGQHFGHFTSTKCPRESTYSIHFVQCSHTRKPAWAQNDAMLEAYVSGMDYFYRINDDTVMRTSRWTEIFIGKLNEMSPPRVGVVGPKHKGGNVGILTYDFTHRTHMEVHGFYYPRRFTDWYGDRWITDVYKPGRSVKLAKVALVHTMETGQRYRNRAVSKSAILRQIEKDKTVVNRYVKTRESGFVKPDPSKVISMALSMNDSAHVWGAIRNAQLVPVVFPGWVLSVYIPYTGAKSSSIIPSNIIKVLTNLSAQIRYVQVANYTEWPLEWPVAWSYLAADDPGVDVFLIRNPWERLSERDAAAVGDWLSRGRDNEVVHSLRDHQRYNATIIVHGQWGAKAGLLREQHLAGTSMSTLLREFLSQKYTDNGSDENRVMNDFLRTVFWNRVKKYVLYHDSVSCDVTGGRTVLPFPMSERLSHTEFIGQTYDAHEQPESSIAERNPQCGSSNG